MKKRVFVGMNVYWFGIAFLWNGLHPIILPALLLYYVPENIKNTTLGAMTFAGLVLAMFVQPAAGSLSDRTRSRFGRRRPWMVGGTLLALVALAFMALAENLWGVLATYILLQLVNNTAHGPAQGLIPDMVPEERRGLASGIKNLFDMSGLVVTSLVAGNLMGSGNPALAVAIIGGVLGFTTLITVLSTPEEAYTANESAVEYRLKDLFSFDREKYPDYARLLAARYLILLGIYAVQGFALYYISDWLGMEDPEVVTGNLMAAIGVAITLFVFPAGWLSDRLGRKNMNIGAGLLAAVGIFLLIFVQNLTMLYIFASLIGMATGIFLSVNWALATDLIPKEEAGKYMGLSNLATAGASATSRLGGPLIDGVNYLLPGTFFGYPALFILASLLTLSGAVLMRRVGEGK